MAKPAVIEARKAKAVEDLAVQVAENNRKLDLIMAELGIGEGKAKGRKKIVKPEAEGPGEAEPAVEPETKPAE